MLNLFDAPPELTEGDIAPDFELTDSFGKSFRLYELLKGGWVILFFYPKDETSGCTAQVCSFRNTYQEFKQLGAEVLGISADSEASHQQFSQKQQLSYPLLSDPQGKIAKAYGIKKSLGIVPGRVTFVIAPDQTIQLAYSSQFNPTSHAEKALAILKAQNNQPQ